MQAIARLLPPFHPGSTAIGLMVVRLVAGAAMMLHGWPKIQNAMGWMEKDFPGHIPPLLQAAAAVAEFGGGICWILGLLTPLASLLILATMTAAVGIVHIPAKDAFVSFTGQTAWDLAALYWSIALMMLFTGPGALSADWCLFGRLAAPEEPAGTEPPRAA